jgi:nicotinate-nucleotide pyrophosphorylase (carboxylating)
MTPGWKHPAPEGWVESVWAALAEDVGPGDLTSVAVNPEEGADWHIEAQSDGVVCGVGIAGYLLQPEFDDPQDDDCETLLDDGEPVGPGTVVLRGRTRVGRLLTRERTALNYLMALSGVATLTHRFVRKLDGLATQVVDTRKTVPGMRALQKYAVRCGGGRNHRMGLYDGIMIKDNHIRAAGSLSEAVSRARHFVGPMSRIEVECETLEQVREAVLAKADIVMLDNMDPFSMAEAVREHRGRVVFEASGGVTLDTVRPIAETGVDVVSVGALTHSAPALAFHLELE